MPTTFMSIPHQTSRPGVLPLAPQQALTLAADAAPRALWVHEGRVWLTRRCSRGQAADVWLEAGQSHALPAGSEWVVEAWPAASVSLVQAAPTVLRRSASAPSWLPVWRRHAGALLASAA